MATGDQILKNKTPFQRTDFALSGLASGGILQPDVQKKFISIAQNATPVLQAARRVDMKSHTTKIPKITFGGRILVAGTAEGTEVAAADRKAPTTSEITLAARKVSGEVKIPYEVFEDNVELDEFETTMLTEIARRLGVDLEELLLKGDTASVDTLLAVLDGWLKRVTSHVVNAGGAAVTKALFEQAIRAVALRYRQARPGYVFYTEDGAAETWRTIVGDRATPAGDQYTLQGEVPPVAGRKVIPVGNMPITAGTPNTAPALFTHPQNLIWGVHRDVRIVPVDAPREEAIYFHISMRLACAVEQEDAASKLTNLQATT